MHISFQIADSTMFEGFGHNRADVTSRAFDFDEISTKSSVFVVSNTLPLFDTTCCPQESSVCSNFSREKNPLASLRLDLNQLWTRARSVWAGVYAVVPVGCEPNRPYRDLPGEVVSVL